MKNIIHRGVNRAAVNFGGTFTQRLHHVFLDVRGLDHHRLKFCFGYRKMQLVTGLDVCCFLEHRHQFGQVEKFGEPRSCPVAGALGVEFVKILFVDFLN